MHRNSKLISRDDLVKMSRGNPVTFYQNLRQILSKVERSSVARLSNEQVLDLAIENYRRGTVDLAVLTAKTNSLLLAARHQIPTDAYSHRARTRSAAPADEVEDEVIEDSTNAVTEDKTRWIEIQVADDISGEHLSNVELILQLPDGNAHSFYTDSNGRVKIEGMNYGAVHIVKVQHQAMDVVKQFS